MKTTIALCLGLAFSAFAGCDDMQNKRTPDRVPPGNQPAATAPTTTTTPVPAPSPGHAEPANSDVTADKPLPPDNTGVNVRDRGDAKTPLDQNENQADIDITAGIRKHVVDTEMSTSAHNVKIITADGKVTLRGPVATAEEKAEVERIAKDVAGEANVDSQLEVTPAKPE